MTRKNSFELACNPATMRTRCTNLLIVQFLTCFT